MKAGLYGVRGKQISLTLIGLIGTTILLWAWEKNPLLTTFLPPPSRVLIPDVYIKEDVSYAVPEGEATTERLEKSYDKDTAGDVKDDENSASSVMERNEINVGTISKEIEPKQYSAEEMNTGPAEVSTNVDSVITINSKHSRDDDSSIAISDGQEISSAVPLKEMEQNEDIEEEIRPKAAEKVSGVIESVVSAIPKTTKQEKSILPEVFEEKKACNYGIGKWVEDSRRPLYSGFGCKQWLSDMWACRLTQRTDFTYETFRWKPRDCEMPEFEGSSFLKRMQDKTIALVGDSLGRQQFQSLMCMVTGGKETHDVVDVGKEYGLVKAHGATRPDGWAFRFPRTNTTILYYWSASLCDIQPINRSNPATDYAMHLDRPAWFLQHYLHRFDVLVLNTGHHWNRGKLNANRWVMHVNGVPNTDRKLAEIGRAKNFTVYSVVKWLDLQLPKHPRLKAFFRTISPRHFFHGDWNSGGTCDNTTPLAGGKEVLQDESVDSSASGAVRGTGVHLLDITAISQLRDEGHISRYSIKATPGVQDCLHWCLPGIPDTWNEILAARV